MIEYRCRACGWWLFSSDAEHGKVEVTCGNRRCDKRQTVYLGGRKPTHLDRESCLTYSSS